MCVDEAGAGVGKQVEGEGEELLHADPHLRNDTTKEKMALWVWITKACMVVLRMY